MSLIIYGCSFSVTCVHGSHRTRIVMWTNSLFQPYDQQVRGLVQVSDTTCSPAYSLCASVRSRTQITGLIHAVAANNLKNRTWIVRATMISADLHKPHLSVGTNPRNPYNDLKTTVDYPPIHPHLNIQTSITC